MGSPFFQIQLRTGDVAAARSFYTSVLGERPLDIVLLDERAVAHGARPTWLGYLDVDDVDRVIAAFVARGGMALGPKWKSAEGLDAAMLRDPGGAIVALACPSPRARAASLDAGVRSYLLNTSNVDAALASYRDLLGWEIRAPEDLGSLGVFHPFAWDVGGPSVGAMSDIAARPGVHPHWLFQLGVVDLDAAANAVRAGGGLALDPIALPTGERVVV